MHKTMFHVENDMNLIDDTNAINEFRYVKE